jgi:hypothetical protein
MSDMLKSRCPKLQEPSKVFIKVVLPYLRKVANTNLDVVISYKQQVEKYMASECGKDMPFFLPKSDKDYADTEKLEMNFIKSPSNKTIQPDKSLTNTSNNGNYVAKINFSFSVVCD